MPIQEPLRITSEVAADLDDLGIPYLVGGSVASSLHGIPRATQDVDMVADLDESSVEDLDLPSALGAAPRHRGSADAPQGGRGAARGG